MTCGLIRLICEESLAPPPGQEGRSIVVDVPPWRVGITVALLWVRGWHVVSRWPL
jgi:hypothetical protein